MPMFDMPLSELRDYMGQSPRPADFDSYWQAALGEMHACDPKVELRPAKFSAPGVECFHLFFTGTGGARVHAKYLRPKGAKSCPVVLAFHGYSGDCGDWSDKLSYLSAGFAVAALDCRGQAGLSEDVGGVIGNTFKGHIIRGLDEKSPHKLLFRDIFLDTALLAEVVAAFPEIDETRMVARGGSQGGALTLVCAALSPRIRRASSMYPFLCDYRRVWDLDLTTRPYEELTEYFRKFDPRHEREEEIFTRLGYIDVQNLAPRISAEVLFAVGLVDQVCPPSTQFAAYNKMTCKKQLVIYPDFGHEGLPEFSDMEFAFLMKV